jgi:hypothetical protein
MLTTSSIYSRLQPSCRFCYPSLVTLDTRDSPIQSAALFFLWHCRSAKGYGYRFWSRHSDGPELGWSNPELIRDLSFGSCVSPEMQSTVSFSSTTKVGEMSFDKSTIAKEG